MGKIIVILLIFMFLLTGPLMAKDVQIKVIDKSKYPEVTITLGLFDSNNEPITDIKTEDFSIIEDGKEMKIVKSSPPDSSRPVNSILVLDRSGSMNGKKLSDAKQACLCYLKLKKSKDNIGSVIFSSNNSIKTVMPSNQIDELSRIINSTKSDGGTAFYDALYEAIKMAQNLPNRRAIICLTDGKENNSRRYSLNECVTMANTSSISIYTIGLGSWWDLNRKELESIANSTGGKSYFTTRPEDLEGLYQSISNQLKKEYEFTYLSPGQQDGRTRYVEISVAGLTGKGIYNPGGIIPSTKISRNNEDYKIFLLFFIIILLLFYIPGIIIAFMKTAESRNRQTVSNNRISIKSQDKPRIRVVTNPSAQSRIRIIKK